MAQYTVSTMKVLVAAMLLVLSVSMVMADQAELVVAKTVLTKNPVAGQDTMVSIRIFNVGSGTAYDLELNDAGWLNENFTATGGLQAKWEKLGPGENVTHNFVVVAPRSTAISPSPAQVTFQESIRGGKAVTVWSSIPSYGYLRFYRPNDVPHRSLPHYTEWIVFAGLLGAGLALPALVYSSSKAVYESLKRK